MMFQKRGEYRNKKILKACKDEGETCTIQLPGCQTSPTVPAHSNSSDDGKGGSIKADDIFVASACNHCHDILDGRKYTLLLGLEGSEYRQEIRWYHDRGIKRTIRRMIDKGILK